MPAKSHNRKRYTIPPKPVARVAPVAAAAVPEEAVKTAAAAAPRNAPAAAKVVAAAAPQRVPAVKAAAVTVPAPRHFYLGREINRTVVVTIVTLIVLIVLTLIFR